MAERRATEVNDQLVGLSRELVGVQEVTEALSAFVPVWESLTPREQARIIHLLIERVDYNGEAGTISITFRPAGIRTLDDELTEASA